MILNTGALWRVCLAVSTCLAACIVSADSSSSSSACEEPMIVPDSGEKIFNAEQLGSEVDGYIDRLDIGLCSEML